MEDDKRFSYFFLGLGIGVAVGILFAPKSGEETRELLREKADEGKEYVRRRTTELREQTRDAIHRGKDVLSRQKEQFSAAVEAGRAAYRESVTAPASAAAGTEEMIEGV